MQVTKFRFHKQPFKEEWGQNAIIDFAKLFVLVFFIRNNVFVAVYAIRILSPVSESLEKLIFENLSDIFFFI
jgi:hypothetical protein